MLKIGDWFGIYVAQSEPIEVKRVVTVRYVYWYDITTRKLYDRGINYDKCIWTELQPNDESPLGGVIKKTLNVISDIAGYEDYAKKNI